MEIRELREYLKEAYFLGKDKYSKEDWIEDIIDRISI